MRALLFGPMVVAIASCGAGSRSPGSPSTSSDKAVVALESLTATAEAIASPGAGWLYRLTYRAHETGGRSGATLTATHAALSTGDTADGTFTGPGVLQVPRIAPFGMITVETNVTVLTTAAAAGHVVFTVTYIDDNGNTGSATASADVFPIK